MVLPPARCIPSAHQEMAYSGVLTLALVTFGPIALCSGCRPVHCGTPSNILDLHPPDASITPPPAMTTKSVFRHCQMFPGWEGV